MKIQTTYVNASQMHGLKHVDKKTAFKSAATYAPRCYREVRDLANAVYEHSKGSQRFLMWLYKLRGENLNNAITAIGTSAVAPFFIRYNVFSHEDKDSRTYSAWRQPISAGITLGGQLLVMSNYNDMLDRHAARAGVSEMDLRAKPPVSVLKPLAKQEYKNYKANAILKGEEYLPKKKWIEKRIQEMQDDAYYKRLRELRETMDITNVPMRDIVKPSAVNAKCNEMFKSILKDVYGLDASEVEKFKDFNEFTKTGKKLLKSKKLDMSVVQDHITGLAEDVAIADLEKVIKFESKVKYKTSQIFKEMNDQFNSQKVEVMKNFTADVPQGTSNNSLLKKIEQEIDKVAKNIYEEKLQQLKAEYEQILQKKPELMTEADNVFVLAYKKVAKQGKLANIKYHGQSLDDVIKSVKIKKWLNTQINLSEVQLKNWKDKSGLVVGLLILPVTCTILNWAYPKIMKKLFPRLSEVKEAKKAALKEARQAELAQESKTKEAK